MRLIANLAYSLSISDIFHNQSGYFFHGIFPFAIGAPPVYHHRNVPNYDDFWLENPGNVKSFTFLLYEKKKKPS